MAERIMLNINHIAKTFNPGTITEKRALTDVDLKLNEGDFVTIIGGNGAGKSTTLNAVAGVFAVDQGTIEIAGVDVTRLPEYKRAKYLGRVFQDPMTGTAATMNIEENMALAMRRGEKRTLRWGISNMERDMYREQLRTLGLGLEERMSSKVGLLSGGQRQALTLLMAALRTPKLLLLDEHTAALDPKTAAKVLELTEKIVAEQKLTAMMVTHNMKDAIAMGNRKLSDIATNLGLKQTGLTKYLKVLMDLDLVEREVPITETAPEKSKSGLYRIADNFIAFWFKFVYPYRAYLEKGETAFVLSQIKKSFAQNYASFVYEDVCREKMWELSAANTWNFHFDKVGRYWGAKAGEIDIVGIDTANGNLVLGECKYTTSPKGLSVLHTLQEKSEAMLKLTQTKNVQYILFSTAGYTQGLIDEAGKNANIKLIERI